MSLPYFNLYPSDFEAKTSHLTLEEDGAYNRLLRLCWMTPGCSLPDDDAWIMRRMRVDAETYERVVRVVLDEFFTRENGRVSNAMLTEWQAEVRKKEKRPWIPIAVQRHIFERDGNACKYCGDTDGPFHIDHIVPWAIGGGHDPENLTIACSSCNWSKGSKTLAEWRGF